MKSFYYPDIQTSVWGQPLLRQNQFGQQQKSPPTGYSAASRITQPHKTTEDAGPFMLTRPQGVLAAMLNEEDLHGDLASDQPLVSVAGDGRDDKTNGDSLDNTYQ